MPEVTFDVVDERSITIPSSLRGLSNEQTEQVGKFITTAAQEGYALYKVSDKVQGDYRGDEYRTGIILTFRKVA